MSNSKLTKEQIEILNSLGFKGTTDSEVRPLILKKLEKFDVFEVDEDPIEDLIGIVQAFMEIEGETEETTEEETTEEISEEEMSVNSSLEDEEEKEVKKVVEKKPKTETKVKKEEKPKKEKVAAKTEGKTERVTYNGDLDSHVQKLKKVLEPHLSKFNLEGSYNKSCVSVSIKKSDSKRSIICVESIVFKGDSVNVKVYFNGINLFKGSNDLREMMEELLDEKFLDRLCLHKNNTYPFVKSVDSLELSDLLTEQIIGKIIEKVESFDKKLRKNRERMEQEYESEKK